MSPEQIVGKSVDGRSDIFSLGVMLYEMLAGKAPFNGETISTIMYRILNDMPPDIGKINKRLPVAFDYIIHKALAKLPENRYQNASELAHDLRHYKTLSLLSPVQLATMKQPPQKTLERRATRRQEAAVTTLEILPDAGKKPSRAYPIIELPGATDRESRLKLTPTPKKHSRSRTGLIGSISLIAIAVALFVFLGNLGTFNVLDANLHPDMSSVVKQGVQADATGSETEPLFSSPAPFWKKTPGAGQDGKKTKVPPATTGKVGYLNFDVTPRGDIYVDGNKVGYSPPLKALQLPPGRHRVEVQSRFPPYIYVFRVNVEVNRSTLVKAQFQPQPGN
jgi:serine/threonine protein kinase